MSKLLIPLSIGLLFLGAGCSSSTSNIYQQGDLSDIGGSPTIRFEYEPEEDDPWTTNDESNDQPLGFYGTTTVDGCTTHNGSCYSLDADFSDGQVERLYFPKGGWVDFYDSDCDGGYCLAYDENGREWEIEYYE